MKAILRTLVLVAAATLSACEAEDFTIPATVVGVEEVEQGEERQQSALHDEDLGIPGIGWRVDLRLDDGENVSLTHNGARRYQPGDHVRLLKADDGRLLL